MSTSDSKIRKVKEFISDYMKHSQQRGPMYGTIEQLESNWDLLCCIHFILNDKYEQLDEAGYREFLSNKLSDAINGATFIKRKGSSDPHNELNKLWNEYEKWRYEKVGF